MKAKVWKGVWALCVVAVTMASCDFVNKSLFKFYLITS
jgi:hypothetical protein